MKSVVLEIRCDGDDSYYHKLSVDVSDRYGIALDNPSDFEADYDHFCDSVLPKIFYALELTLPRNWFFDRIKVLN